jgi:hypothetical protein
MVHQFPQNLIDKPLMSSFSDFFFDGGKLCFYRKQEHTNKLTSFYKTRAKGKL